MGIRGASNEVCIMYQTYVQAQVKWTLYELFVALIEFCKSVNDTSNVGFS